MYSIKVKALNSACDFIIAEKIPSLEIAEKFAELVFARPNDFEIGCVPESVSVVNESGEDEIVVE